MAKIKDITKELTGKSLCSFHRKTGLPQLEETNKMQDGILDGILSQVDDAYIKKTEQSNVIHLEGSGDGVVVLDGIEGNTMVNLLPYNENYWGSNTNSNTNTIWSVYKTYKNFQPLKSNTKYTLLIDKMPTNGTHLYFNYYIDEELVFVVHYTKGNKLVFITPNTIPNGNVHICTPHIKGDTNDVAIEVPNATSNFYLLKGDWTNKEIPPYFKGLQSSFEEKINDEGKYEIEILMNNKNLFNIEDVRLGSYANSNGITPSVINGKLILNGTTSNIYDYRTVQSSWNPKLAKYVNKLPVGTTITMSNNLNGINYWAVMRDGVIKYFTNSLTIQNGDTSIGAFVRFDTGIVLNNAELKVQIEIDKNTTEYIPSKQNKIKVLINEPLRGIGDIKDRLCIKDNKLVIERKLEKNILDGTQNYEKLSGMDLDNTLIFRKKERIPSINYATHLNDKLPSYIDTLSSRDVEGTYIFDNTIRVRINKSKLLTQDLDGFNSWITNNPIVTVYPLAEPVYEEVLNEYGEPIILEGYENGTIYIDSNIVPTTTVRYTPKIESFKVCSEVKENNVALSSDINDNIITYMMDIDLMITEKELITLDVQAINQRMEVLDMTSMQKRTQDMLARLIKGKTLTEQECKDRIILYVNANKITAEQAEELMLLISETYQ